MRLSSFRQLSYFIVSLAFVNGSTLANHGVSNLIFLRHQQKVNLTQTIDYTDPKDNYQLVSGFVGLNKENVELRNRAAALAAESEAEAKVIGLPDKFVNAFLRRAESSRATERKLNTYIVDVPMDPKKWTHDDLVKLATTHSRSVQAFDALVFLRYAAKDVDKSGNFSEKALTAQQALAQFMPEKYDDIKLNFVDFINEINAVDKLTRQHPVRVAMQARRPPMSIPPSPSKL
ncbi:hypothetical protein [Spirosoma endbachense]|uniref:Uncharacterized protein n=1 Tax=Spirosoma endbachense TaxID=2666025 RepID=A0A6P1W1R4_9BACT|nr:hypothetical protein [Spirosoma endbachense]QHV99353.1 hypothetical protein GJR95_32000 [Spirosoma endbachense]